MAGEEDMMIIRLLLVIIILILVGPLLLEMFATGLFLAAQD